ncbi:MAG: hypothetical protein HN641_13025 [Candidatus Marinimicrobia bacterium]|nr:hypothetical protein [Candidatus Neomarinimicrobiota bacterium]
MKLTCYGILSVIILLLTSCDDTISIEEDIVSSNPDEYGNLYINNQIDENLILYRAGTLVKRIPANSEEFLININNTPGTPVDLKIWKEDDVADLENPDENLLYRRWVVLLSSNTNDESRKHWIIDNSIGSSTGQVYFNYPEIFLNGNPNIYNVDVYLNHMNGAKIVSLFPGDSIIVGLRYDLYNLYYFYWLSNGSTENGIQPVDWFDGNDQIVINSNDDTEEIIIPTCDVCSVGRLGIINISNNLGELIRINAGNLPISYSTSNPSEANSLLTPGSSYSFEIWISNYNFSASNIDNISIFETIENIDIIENFEFTWNVDGINELEDPLLIEVNNQTGYGFSLNDFYDNSYLGHYIESNSSKYISINNLRNNIKAIDYSNSIGSILYPLTDSWEITITDTQPIIDLDIISKYDYLVLEKSNCDSSIIGILNSEPYYLPVVVDFWNISLSSVGDIEYWNWYINGIENILLSNEEHILLPFDEEGSYDIDLIISVNGVENTYGKTLTFENKPIYLISPNCNTDSITGEDTLEIRWGFNAQLFSNTTNIYISINNDVNIIKVTNIGAESYEWPIDLSDISDSNKVVLTIYHLDNIYQDESDEYFTITP